MIDREPAIRIRGLSKTFRRAGGTVVTPVDDLSLDIAHGSFVVLLGPSGCGKTTLLRCIAGLEQPDIGEIEIDGRPVFSSVSGANVPAEKRKLGMIFQSYALWPHMTAFENVAYPLKSRRSSKAAVNQRVEETLALVGVEELANQYPSQMSGGQQQRVALARAIAPQNSVILFDEPLSNVDAKVRENLRVELMQMQRTLGFTAIYVTHDQAEAMVLGDRIAVLRQGKIAQLGAPREVYGRPFSRYVAQFVGTANEIPGEVVAVEGERVTVVTKMGDVRGITRSGSLSPGQRVVAVIRPERALVTDAPTSEDNCWKTFIPYSVFLGPHAEHHVRFGDTTLRVWSSDVERDYAGEQVWLSLAAQHVFVLPAEHDEASHHQADSLVNSS